MPATRGAEEILGALRMMLGRGAGRPRAGQDSLRIESSQKFCGKLRMTYGRFKVTRAKPRVTFLFAPIRGISTSSNFRTSDQPNTQAHPCPKAQTLSLNHSIQQLTPFPISPT